MMTFKPSKIILPLLTAGLVGVGLLGCAELNDPYNSGGSRDPYYDRGGYRDDDYRRINWERTREERRELERERERVEHERRRLEEERNRVYIPPAPSRHDEHCPPGFSPSERKCTKDERKRGCRDVRTSSGLGCVDRR